LLEELSSSAQCIISSMYVAVWKRSLIKNKCCVDRKV